jgi:hypothetical protein
MEDLYVRKDYFREIIQKSYFKRQQSLPGHWTFKSLEETEEKRKRGGEW